MARVEDILRLGLGIAYGVSTLACRPYLASWEVKATPTATVEPTATPVYSDEAKRLGVLLENFDSTKFSGIERHGYFVDEVAINNISPNYRVRLNLDALRYWKDRCKVKSFGNTVVIDLLSKTPSKLTESEVGPHSVAARIPLDDLYDSLDRGLLDSQYHVSPAKRAIALRNAVTARANVTVIGEMCGGSEAGFLHRYTGASDETIRMVRHRARVDANEHEAGMLKGTLPLIFTVERVITDQTL